VSHLDPTITTVISVAMTIMSVTRFDYYGNSSCYDYYECYQVYYNKHGFNMDINIFMMITRFNTTMLGLLRSL